MAEADGHVVYLLDRAKQELVLVQRRQGGNEEGVSHWAWAAMVEPQMLRPSPLPRASRPRTTTQSTHAMMVRLLCSAPSLMACLCVARTGATCLRRERDVAMLRAVLVPLSSALARCLLYASDVCIPQYESTYRSWRDGASRASADV